jgi:hypothetical protein
VNWSKTRRSRRSAPRVRASRSTWQGREHDGIVDPADSEEVRDQVMDTLSSFVDPKTGHKPVKEIYRREEIFKGKHADTARDILMEPAEGYSLTTVGPRTVAVSPGGGGDAVVTRHRAKIGHRRSRAVSPTRFHARDDRRRPLVAGACFPETGFRFLCTQGRGGSTPPSPTGSDPRGLGRRKYSEGRTFGRTPTRLEGAGHATSWASRTGRVRCHPN